MLQREKKYGDVLNLWLISAQINLKESSYARYYALVENHIRPVLGEYRLSQLNTVLLQGYLRQLLNQGRLDGKGGLSAKSASDILAIVKSSLEYAKDSGYPIPCSFRRLSVKKRDREMRVLTAGEQRCLCEFLLKDTDAAKLGILICLYTGLRIGEICALKWKHLRLEEGILEVRATLQRIQNVCGRGGTRTTVIITEPKSRCAVRDIPLPQFITRLARRFEGPPEAFVLTGEKDKFIEPRTLQNKYKKCAEECEIRLTNYHCLRHTFATRCIEAGFEIKSLSEILGHANVNITLNRYVHSSFELKRENMLKLEAAANA